MKILSFAQARPWLLGALLSTAVLGLTACSDNADTTTGTQDYTAQDEATIRQYLASNKLPAARRLASGLYYAPLTADTSGTRATAGRTVSVRYTGQLLDGTVFDASSKHGNEPFDFVLGEGKVIAGWDQGIALMHKGQKGVLLSPSALGYGPEGAGSDIPPNAVLRFDVELLDVK
jgi:FKBP-type peptidyl-prolyl cis-trans isomerase